MQGVGGRRIVKWFIHLPITTTTVTVTITVGEESGRGYLGGGHGLKDGVGLRL
jgi:hypothetical protein